MTIRNKLLLYLVILHVLLLLAGVAVLYLHYRPWIIALELLVVVSLVVGISLTRGFGLPLDLISIGTEFIRERDFSHTFAEVGSSDLNKLVKLYNEMISRLREERLRGEEQQLFLEKLVNASPTGIITLDTEGKIDLLNPSAANFLNSNVASLKGKEPGTLDSSLGKALSKLGVDREEVIQTSGRKRLKVIHSQYFDLGIKRSFFLVIELTRELWKSEKTAYETLIRTLSHEVNNTIGATNSILKSVLAYSKQLEEDDRLDFENALDVAIERTENLNRFMRSYADVIRLPDPSRELVNPEHLILRITELIKSECKQRKIALNFVSNGNVGKVSLDVAQMEQALMNIIRNAIEAIGENGQIEIVLHKHNGSLELAIEDSGPGLSDDARENLFNPFFSTKENGQGIGLTLVHEILTRHGFEFALESDRDEPTRFYIRL